MSRRSGQRPDEVAGFAKLDQTLADAANLISPQSRMDGSGDGFVYSGNRHETVPQALFHDARLTPLERNAWQVLRMLLHTEGISALPTYERLRPFLTSTPCSGHASDETVARALMILRLARWLTLARRRCMKSGRIQGNLYVLHDEPLTPFEAIQLDPRYLELVSRALEHASKAIQRVAAFTVKEIESDPMLSGRHLPSRLHTLVQRLERQGWTQAELPSDSEEGSGARDQHPLRNPKKDSTVRTHIYKEIRTVQENSRAQPLAFPEAFGQLSSEQQAGARAALRQVDTGQQQLVLDEWATRCRNSTVRNPAGYLYGIIQKALRGEFNAWVRHAGGRRDTQSAARSAGDTDSATELARANLARLRESLKSN